MNRLKQLSKILILVVAIAGLTFVVTGNIASANNSSDLSFENNSSDFADPKCGGDDAKAATSAEKKCGDGKTDEAKCGEGKEECDGKCGHDKSTEAKCGEGKCGGDDAKAATTEEAKCGDGKTDEAKCGEGKCG